MTPFLGALCGVGVATGLLLAVAGWRGWSPTWGPRSLGRLRALDREARRRLVVAAGAGVAVAVVSRWPVAIVASIALAWFWPRMFGAAKVARLEVERLEAVATWTESLRDTMAGSIGLEQAIVATVDAAPDAIRSSLVRLAGRLRAHEPLPIALSSFADEFDDASVDLVVAALVLNARLRGPGLTKTLTALAGSAREELEMRVQVEASRKNLRRAATIITAVTAIFAGGLVLFSRDYVEPYGTPAGQVVLCGVIAVFVAGFAWIRQASTSAPAPRFLASTDQLARVGAGGARR